MKVRKCAVHMMQHHGQNWEIFVNLAAIHALAPATNTHTLTKSTSLLPSHPLYSHIRYYGGFWIQWIVLQLRQGGPPLC